MVQLLNLYPEAFGVNISDTSIKLAKLKRKGQGYRLVSYAQAHIETGVIENGEIKDPIRVAQGIRDAMDHVTGQSLGTTHIVASLPEQKAVVQNIQLPRMKQEEVASAIRLQAENYIPYPLETVYIDYDVVFSPHENNHIDVFLVSIPRTIVDPYVEVFEQVGLSPIALEVESLALGRALIYSKPVTRPLLVVDLGSAHTNISIFSGFTLQVITSLPVSFRALIQETLHVSEQKAEELIRTYGVQEKEQGASQQVKEVLRPALRELAEHVQKYMEYYKSYTPHGHEAQQQEKVATVMLCGGGASLPGLADFFADALKIKVVVGDPWVNILSASSREIPMISFEDSLRFTAALGLALRGVSQDISLTSGYD